MTTHFEIYVQPDDGPLTVSERGFNNEISFTEENVAIETARRKKLYYNNLDFLVLKITSGHASSSEVREVVYRTREHEVLK